MTRSKRAGGPPAGKTTMTLAVTAILLMSSLVIGVSALATQEPGPEWDQSRLQYDLRPLVPQEGAGEPYTGNPGLYVNIHPTHVDAIGNPVPTLRVYGEDGEGAAWPAYATLKDSFDPSVIPKDSVTFNPAMIQHDDADFTQAQPTFAWLRGCDEEDSNLKKHLRTWYEPTHDYDGARAQAGFWQPPTTADVIQVESTYYLISAGTYDPIPMCAGESRIPFPTDGTEGAKHAPLNLDFGSDATDAWPQPGLDTMRQVHVESLVVGDTPTTGTVELERKNVMLTTDPAGGIGDSVQMFDHIYRYDGIQTDFNGNARAKFTVWYAGNTVPDSATTILLGGDNSKQYLSRANNVFSTPAHPSENPTAPRTSYIEVTSFTDDTVTMNVGKEIRGTDVFYVDGVRYDIPSVHVTFDSGRSQEVLNQITLRTPIPKSDPNHNDNTGAAWSSVDNDQIKDRNREIYAGGQWQVEDWSVVTTQRLVEVDYNDPIPVDPPFNHEFYRQVDDIDVILWKEGPDPLSDCGPVDANSTFPWGRGASLGSVDDENGLPVFPLGHTYVTMQDPPQDWLDCFDAEPTDYDELFTRGAPGSPIDEPGINHDAWVGGVPAIPIDADAGETNFYWVAEWCEDRFHSNLQEVLHETDPANLHATWTSFGIASHPCKYTEFVFPDRSNPYSGLEDLYYDSNKGDLTLPSTFDLLKELQFGDYLVMTSHRLQDGDTRFAFTHKGHVPGSQLVDFDFDVGITAATPRGDPFVATLNAPEANFRELARIYGEPGFGAIDYTEYWHAFDPYAIQKDSAVFNPAIILHTDPDFTGNDATFGWLKACDESNSNLKKHLRMWYEPDHVFDGPRVPAPYDPATRADVLQIESTYLLVDSGDFEPRTMCPQTNLPFPTEGYKAFVPGTGQPLQVEGDAQPGLNNMTKVTVGAVSGSGTAGQVELTRKDVTLVQGETIQMFDHLYRFDGIEETLADGTHIAKFTVWYMGNPVADSSAVLQIGSERKYISRAPAFFDAPSHGETLPVRTSFLDLTGASFTDPDVGLQSVTFTVGKEIAKGDTFYVTGVRYDIPAVYVKDDPFANEPGVQYITMRNPIPKGNPNYNNSTESPWTSVPSELLPGRVNYDVIAKEWLIEDWSVVSTQRIRQCDGSLLDVQQFSTDDVASVCPIWVNPPFNHEFYRMVDDTNVQMWEMGTELETDCMAGWPWGEANDAVPGGNGLPKFPLGHTYLTSANPPQDWIDCFDAEPTGYEALEMRVDQNAAPGQPGFDEPGYSYDNWHFSGLGADAFPIEHEELEVENVAWLKEWCEGRYSTNLLQVPEEIGGTVVFGTLEIDSQPCQYTELFLADRSNPFSSDVGELLTGKNDGVPAGLYSLLGGDYLITTSLLMQNAVTSGGFDTYDDNGDCVVGQEELMAAVNDWFDGTLSLEELGVTVFNWKNSNLGTPGDAEDVHTHYPGCTHA